MKKKLMKLKKLTSLSLAALILFGMLAASIPSLILPASAASSTYDCYGTVHEVADNAGYTPSHQTNMVSKTSTGHTSLGRLTINCDGGAYNKYCIIEQSQCALGFGRKIYVTGRVKEDKIGIFA